MCKCVYGIGLGFRIKRKGSWIWKTMLELEPKSLEIERTKAQTPHHEKLQINYTKFKILTIGFLKKEEPHNNTSA